MILLARENPQPVNGQLSTLAPPPRIDQLWCLHLAESYSYTQMCAQLSPVGAYLHHSTLRSLPASRMERLQRAAQAYRKRFGSPPVSAVWQDVDGNALPDSEVCLTSTLASGRGSVPAPGGVGIHVPYSTRVPMTSRAGIPTPCGAGIAASSLVGVPVPGRMGTPAPVRAEHVVDTERRGCKRAAPEAWRTSLVPRLQREASITGDLCEGAEATGPAGPGSVQEDGGKGGGAGNRVVIFVDAGVGRPIEFKVSLDVRMTKMQLAIEREIENRRGAVAVGKLFTPDAEFANLDWTLRQHGLEGGETLTWMPEQVGC